MRFSYLKAATSIDEQAGRRGGACIIYFFGGPDNFSRKRRTKKMEEEKDRLPGIFLSCTGLEKQKRLVRTGSFLIRLFSLYFVFSGLSLYYLGKGTQNWFDKNESTSIFFVEPSVVRRRDRDVH